MTVRHSWPVGKNPPRWATDKDKRIALLERALRLLAQIFGERGPCPVGFDDRAQCGDKPSDFFDRLSPEEANDFCSNCWRKWALSEAEEELGDDPPRR